MTPPAELPIDPSRDHEESRRRGAPRRGERGYVTIFTAGVLLAMWLTIGLVLDAGRAFRGRSEGFGTAGAAARAGAQQIDERVGVQRGEAIIDQGAAQNAVHGYIQDRSPGLTVESISFPGGEDSNQITVTVSGETDLWILPGGSVGFQVSATVTAHQGAP